jgi:hypothetical protein
MNRAEVSYAKTARVKLNTEEFGMRGQTVLSRILTRQGPRSTALTLAFVVSLTFTLPALHAQQQPTPESKAVQKQVVKKTADDAKQDKSVAADQPSFDSPEAAMQALQVAVNSDGPTALRNLVGSGSDQLLSGDPVADAQDQADFAAAMQVSAQLQEDSDTQYTILVGTDNWPSPIPVVKRGDRWVFDAKAALEEILNRRVGSNELSAIETSRAYVLAQWEYFVNAYGNNDGFATYAQKFISTPGGQDGLYWDTPEDADPSPMGKLVALARSEGYGSGGPANTGQKKKASATEEHAPFHGYYFKILTRQGVSAPGGRYSYIINGNMIAGFALVAYPATWGNSGVMTFIVNQQGRVYQKNLGADTAKIAGAMSEYNPDPSWKRVDDDVVDADVDAADDDTPAK